MQRDSIGHTFKVTIILCLVCSALVSTAAVVLRPFQETNREQFKQQNILVAAGLWDPKADIKELFEQVEEKVVDFQADWYAEGVAPQDVHFVKPTKAADGLNEPVPAEKDIASIKRRERYAYVYLVKKDGRYDQVVLPIRGYGLWSTLYGFLAIDLASLAKGPEQAEIRGLTFYKHAETPGLGGEVDNPNWKALWKGKKAFDDDWSVLIEVAKQAKGDYQVDAISAATFTSRGVTNMLRYWLGDDGFGPYLKKLRQEQPKQARAGGRNG